MSWPRGLLEMQSFMLFHRPTKADSTKAFYQESSDDLDIREGLRSTVLKDVGGYVFVLFCFVTNK